jgi:hypothetical protein
MRIALVAKAFERIRLTTSSIPYSPLLPFFFMNKNLPTRGKAAVWRLFALFLLLSSRAAWAQVDSYQFAASTGTFTPLPATATPVTGIYVDDAVTGQLPIGFTFVYDGSPYTQFTATSNGWLSFNPSAASQAGFILYDNVLALTGNGDIKPLVTPFWDDLTGTGGAASYQTTGTAPNRVFTFEFLNWRRLGATGAQFSIQVKLFETTNVVQYIYRQEATVLTGATASIGLAGAVAGTPASTSFLSLSDASATPTASSSVETNTIGSPPATGQIYTFTPPVPSACPTPRNLTATNITATSAQLNYFVLGGGGTFTILYGVAGFNPTQPSSGTNQYTTLTGITGTSTTITGLTASTNYQFYVIQNCGGAAGNSSMSNAGGFQSACITPPYATVPFLEDFEGTWISRCNTRDVPSNNWRNTPATGNLSWRRDDDGASANWSNSFGNFIIPANQGLHTARFHDYSASTAAGLASTFDLFINLSSTGAKVLQFDYINTSGTDSLLVEVSTNGGVSFGPVLLRLNVAAAFTTQSVSLPAANSATSVIRFRAKTDLFGSTDIGVDNVRVAALTAPPGCVTNVSPASGATGVVRPVTITWTAGTGIATSYDIYFGTTPTPPLATTQAGTSYVPTANLASNTTYYFQIVPRNGVGAATGCPVYSFTTGTTFNYCNTGLGGFCGSSEISAVNVAGSGLNSTGLTCTAGTGGQTYQVLPPTGNNTGTMLRGVTYSVEVTLTSASIVSVWIDFNQNGSFEATEWTQITTNGTGLVSANIQVPLGAALGQTGLRVRSRNNGNQNGAGDACLNFGSGETKDFTITIGPAPACPPPSNLTATAITTTSASLGFVTSGTGTFTLVYGPAGFNPATGGTTITNATSPVVVTGLTPGTTYQFYVQQNCGAAGLSQNTGPTNFTTLITNDAPCGATALPVNNTCVPLSTTTAGATASAASIPAGTCPSFPNTTPADVWYSFTTAATGPTSTSVRITVTGAPAGTLRAYSGACAGPLTFLSCSSASNGTTAAPNLDLTSLTPSTTYYVRVGAYDAFQPTLGNFTICASPVPNCPAPTAPTAGTLTNTTAQVSWSTTPSAGSTFTVIYGLTGFDPNTAGTSITGITGTSTTLTGLSPSTTYCFYVQQVCGGFNGSSTRVGPACFTTPLTAPNNDEPCGAVTLGNSVLTNSNQGATTSVQNGINLPACSPSQAPKDVWFTIVPSGNSTTLTLTGTSAGMVRVFESPSCANGLFNQVFCQSSGTNNQSVGTMNVTGLTPGARYYVAVSGYGSSDTPGTFTIVGTNLLASRAQAETNALLVYPNPSSTGQLTLRLDGFHGNGQASLLNALGQVVLTKALAAGTTEQVLSTRALAAGLYTLRVQIGGQVLTRKIALE